MRNKTTGTIGDASLVYDRTSGRYFGSEKEMYQSVAAEAKVRADAALERDRLHRAEREDAKGAQAQAQAQARGALLDQVQAHGRTAPVRDPMQPQGQDVDPAAEPLAIVLSGAGQ